MNAITSASLEHAIGPDGLFVLRLRKGAVRLRGTDREVARVVDAAGTDLEGWVGVERAEGSLAVSVTKGNPAKGSGRGGDAQLLVELPRRATVVVEAGSADLVAEDLVGEQRYQSVSGDVTLSRLAGQVTVEAVSGDVRLSSAGHLHLRARTVSGDIEARGRFAATSLATTSGDVSLAGELVPDREHQIETVSGDTLLALVGGARVEVTSVTGDVSAHLPHRSEGGRGRRVVLVGDARATLTARSMSGDVRIVAARPFDGSGHEEPAVPAGHGAPAPAATPVQPTDADPSAAAIEAAYEEARLGILRGLERGDYDVAEAGRRLEALDGADGAGGRTDA